MPEKSDEVKRSQELRAIVDKVQEFLDHFGNDTTTMGDQRQGLSETMSTLASTLTDHDAAAGEAALKSIEAVGGRYAELAQELRDLPGWPPSD